MPTSRASTPQALVRVLCVIAVVLGVAGLGSVATRGVAAQQDAPSFDADANGSLDFFDVAQQLERDDAYAFVTFFVNRVERGGSGDLHEPIERELEHTVRVAAIAPPNGPQDQHDAVVSQPEQHDSSTAHAHVRGHELWLHQGDLGARCARGPPSLF